MPNLRRAVRRWGAPAAAAAALPASHVARRALTGQEGERIRRRAATFEQLGGHLWLPSQRPFPAVLDAADWMPPFLFCVGDLDRLPVHKVTIVGTRRATPSATAWTEDVARQVAREGVGVISGMALGIDGAAHLGALNGNGVTIAVLGSGADVAYPRDHAALYRRIIETGLVLSEFPPGTTPRRHHFPRRNRILAALADAVLVAQAPRRSGALITADYALELGVEVLATPGDPLLPECAGSNQLLLEGARPALDAAGLLGAVTGEERVPPADPQPDPWPQALDNVSARVLRALDFVPQPLESLAERTGHGTARLLAALSQLGAHGLAEAVPGGRWRMTPLGARSRVRPAARRSARTMRRPS